MAGRFKLPTQREIREGCEKTGGDYGVYIAVYSREGVQLQAMHGPATKAYARRVAEIQMLGHKTHRGLRTDK